MIQDYNELNLTELPVPNPDFKTLSLIERRLAGSYVKKQYLRDATYNKDKLKKDLYYNGMKYTLRDYEKYFLMNAVLLLSYSVTWPLLAVICHFAVSSCTPYFIRATALILTLFNGFIISLFNWAQKKEQKKYRISKGIPLDKSLKRVVLLNYSVTMPLLAVIFYFAVSRVILHISYVPHL